MSIKTLLKAVPPPDRPFEAFTGPWEPIEAELGTALPQDYKDFVRIYGSGYFMQFLGVAVPRSNNPNTRFESGVGLVSGMFAMLDEEPPYPMWPAAGGLIAFGGTDNGDFLFWLAQGAPDDWRVVVGDDEMWEFEALDCNLTDFLAGLATGAVAPKAFPSDLLPCDRLFQPSRDPSGTQRKFAVAGRLGLCGYEGSGALSPGSHPPDGAAEGQLSVRFRVSLRPQP